MRIVSLLPAATEIVCALGLRRNLVGRSHGCDFPADVAELPALTRARVDASLPGEELDAEVRRIVAEHLPIYELDEELLSDLAPDVVVTQEACEVCAISQAQVASSLERTAPRARLVSLGPSRLADVLGNVGAVAAACGAGEPGASLIEELKSRLKRIPRPDAGRRPRVAVVEWLAPPMLAGHWVPETIEAAGGVPVGPAAGTASCYASWDEVRALGPDAILVAPCGFDLPRLLVEARGLGDTLGGLAARVLLLDGNAYLNRPGPRLVDAAEAIGGWLRGEAIPRDKGLDLREARDVLAAVD